MPFTWKNPPFLIGKRKWWVFKEFLYNPSWLLFLSAPGFSWKERLRVGYHPEAKTPGVSEALKRLWNDFDFKTSITKAVSWIEIVVVFTLKDPVVVLCTIETIDKTKSLEELIIRSHLFSQVTTQISATGSLYEDMFWWLNNRHPLIFCVAIHPGPSPRSARWRLHSHCGVPDRLAFRCSEAVFGICWNFGKAFRGPNYDPNWMLPFKISFWVFGSKIKSGEKSNHRYPLQTFPFPKNNNDHFFLVMPTSDKSWQIHTMRNYKFIPWQSMFLNLYKAYQVLFSSIHFGQGDQVPPAG